MPVTIICTLQREKDWMTIYKISPNGVHNIKCTYMIFRAQSVNVRTYVHIYVCMCLCMYVCMYVRMYVRTYVPTFLHTNFHTYVRINNTFHETFQRLYEVQCWSFRINLKQNISVYSITKQCCSLMLLLNKNWNWNCHVSSLRFSVALLSSCVMPLAHYIFVVSVDECCW